MNLLRWLFEPKPVRFLDRSPDTSNHVDMSSRRFQRRLQVHEQRTIDDTLSAVVHRRIGNGRRGRIDRHVPDI